MIPYCRANGIGLIPWGPMAGGVLARPFHENTTSKRFSTTMLSPFKESFPDADQLIIGRVEELGNRHAVTMAE